MKKNVLLLMLLLGSSASIAQIHRTLDAKRTKQKIVLDGKLDDAAWQDAAKIEDFTEFRPVPNRKEDKSHRTEAKIMYNDDGIYFGGTCFEATKDSIATELIGRDNFGANDFICIIFDTYNDKLNGFEYFLTPLNEQMDGKITANSENSEDISWNAVWQSATKIHDHGWDFEMFIPYSAIRFSKNNVQNWGVNFSRRRNKIQQQFAWNPVDITINGFLTQGGLWQGIEDIKPPVRLQFFPYFSVYENHFPSNVAGQSGWSNQISGGLDLKWGINQAFTLDATLIPDFGQVQSDNNVLNLTPFEVQFNENRTFFTEGTELFSKGNLFYSRRIGGTPLHQYDVYNDLKANEEVIRNPSESKLINASKISGRNKNGLGVGLLNAITKAQFATIQNKETGATRQVETDPATNYNLFVLDQTFKNNSSVSLVNTSVIRGGDDYNANVTKGLFSFTDKKNMYNVSGNVGVSHLNFKNKGTENSVGYSHSIGFSKTSGKFTFGINQDLVDKKFNSNDLGYFTNSNFIDHSLYASYVINEPKAWRNKVFANVGSYISYLYAPFGDIKTKFQVANYRGNFRIQTKKLRWVGMFMNFNPAQNDFYEPRQEGYFFRKGASVGYGGSFESNDAKKYSLSIDFFQRRFINFYNLVGQNISISQSYRFNSKFSIRHSVDFESRNNGMGYTTTLNDKTIILALRKVQSINNILNLKYSFTNRMGLTFRARHYLSNVQNIDLFALQKDGSLKSRADISERFNRNANFFNIDMVYTWQFAAGSFLNVVWKNAISNNSSIADRSYFQNLDTTIADNQNNTLSLKVIYFLDYLQLKPKKS